MRVSAESHGRQCVRDVALDPTVQKLHFRLYLLIFKHYFFTADTLTHEIITRMAVT